MMKNLIQWMQVVHHFNQILIHIATHLAVAYIKYRNALVKARVLKVTGAPKSKEP